MLALTGVATVSEFMACADPVLRASMLAVGRRAWEVRRQELEH